jgi:hypothetical protein
MSKLINCKFGQVICTQGDDFDSLREGERKAEKKRRKEEKLITGVHCSELVLRRSRSAADFYIEER